MVASSESSIGNADHESAVGAQVKEGDVGVSVVQLKARDGGHHTARGSAKLLDLCSPTSQWSLLAWQEICPRNAKERSWCQRTAALAQLQWLWLQEPSV